MLLLLLLLLLLLVVVMLVLLLVVRGSRSKTRRMPVVSAFAPQLTPPLWGAHANPPCVRSHYAIRRTLYVRPLHDMPMSKTVR